MVFRKEKHDYSIQEMSARFNIWWKSELEQKLIKDREHNEEQFRLFDEKNSLWPYIVQPTN